MIAILRNCMILSPNFRSRCSFPLPRGERARVRAAALPPASPLSNVLQQQLGQRHFRPRAEMADDLAGAERGDTPAGRVVAALGIAEQEARGIEIARTRE